MDFFWLKNKKIAGGSLPKSQDNINLLLENGITNLISLAYCNNVKNLILGSDIKHHCIEIEDFSIPSKEQIYEFNKIIDELGREDAVYVHCYAGCGRTGTMLALNLVYNGMSATEAISDVRKVRPCSLETTEQEMMVIEYQKNKSN